MKEIALKGRKNNTGICCICKHPSQLDKKIIAQCVQKIPISMDGEMKYLVTTYPFD